MQVAPTLISPQNNVNSCLSREDISSGDCQIFINGLWQNCCRLILSYFSYRYGYVEKKQSRFDKNSISYVNNVNIKWESYIGQPIEYKPLVTDATNSI